MFIGESVIGNETFSGENPDRRPLWKESREADSDWTITIPRDEEFVDAS